MKTCFQLLLTASALDTYAFCTGFIGPSGQKGMPGISGRPGTPGFRGEFGKVGHPGLLGMEGGYDPRGQT